MNRRERILFTVAINQIAAKFGGSVANAGSAYIEGLFHEWSAAGKPEKSRWLSKRLASEFQSVGVPPVWVYSRDAWPFLNGRPMVFVSQHSLPNNETTRSSLEVDTTVYLFGARVPLGGGRYEIVYEVLSQPIDYGTDADGVLQD